MSTNDQRAIARFEANQALQDIQVRFQRIDALSQTLPEQQGAEIRALLHQAWQGATAMDEVIERANDILKQANEYVEKTTQLAVDMQTQRDAAMDEINKLINDLKSMNYNSATVRELHNDWEETHNAAFWESLPYDIAYTLGEDWNYMQANDLYTLMTIDLREYDEDSEALVHDFGWTLEQVNQARADLLNVIKRLRGELPENK